MSEKALKLIIFILSLILISISGYRIYEYFNYKNNKNDSVQENETEKNDSSNDHLESIDSNKTNDFVESKEDSNFYDFVKNEKVISIKEASYQSGKKLIYNDDIKLEFEFSDNVYEAGINSADIVIKSNDKEIFNGKDYWFVYPMYIAKYNDMYLIYIWGIMDACVTPQAIIAVDSNGNLLKSVNNVEKNDDFDDMIFVKRASKVMLEIDKNGLLLENYISCGITSPLGICDNDEYRDKYIAKTYIYELVGNSLNLIDTKYETTKDYCEKTNE